jgi:hypothetical protein
VREQIGRGADWIKLYPSRRILLHCHGSSSATAGGMHPRGRGADED